MKRVYKIRIGEEVCYSTRILDVFTFLTRFLFADCKDGSYRFDLEVHHLKSLSSCGKIDVFTSSLPSSMSFSNNS